MPYADPDDQRRWLAGRLRQGYGRALYRQRQQRAQNERAFRVAITRAVELLTDIQEQRPRSVATALERIQEVEDVLAGALLAAPTPRRPLDYMKEETP